MNESWTVQFVEGFNAFFSAKHTWECPYLPASDAAFEWYDGYAYAVSEQYFVKQA